MAEGIDDALNEIVQRFATPTFQEKCRAQSEKLSELFGVRVDLFMSSFRRAVGQVLSDHGVLPPDERRKKIKGMNLLVHPDRCALDEGLNATPVSVALAALKNDTHFLNEPLELDGVTHAMKPGDKDKRTIGDRLGKVFFRGLIDVDSNARELSRPDWSKGPKPVQEILKKLKQNYDAMEDEGECCALLSQFLASLMKAIGKDQEITVELMKESGGSTLPVFGNAVFVDDKLCLLPRNGRNPFEDLIFWFLSYAEIPPNNPLGIIKNYIYFHSENQLERPVKTVVKTIEEGLATFHPLDLLSEQELSELSNESRIIWLNTIDADDIGHRRSNQQEVSAVTRLIEATPLDPEFSQICAEAGERIRQKNLPDVLEGWGKMTRDAKKQAVEKAFRQIHECFIEAVPGLEGADVPTILFGAPNPHFYNYDHKIETTNYSHHVAHYKSQVFSQFDSKKIASPPKGEIIFIPSVDSFPPSERKLPENPLWSMTDVREVVEHLLALCFRSFYDHRILRASDQLEELGLLTDLRARRSTAKHVKCNDYAQIDKLTPSVYQRPNAGETSMRILAANPRERWLQMVLNHVNKKDPLMIPSAT